MAVPRMARVPTAAPAFPTAVPRPERPERLERPERMLGRPECEPERPERVLERPDIRPLVWRENPPGRGEVMVMVTAVQERGRGERRMVPVIEAGVAVGNSWRRLAT